MDDQETYDRARKRAETKIGFYWHLAAYVVANGIMIAIALMSTPPKYWFVWPLGGWGIGLVLHGIKVFSADGPSKIKQRMIDHELERERRANDAPGGSAS